MFLFPHSSRFSIYLQPIVMLTSLSEDCDVCNHTEWSPTTQEFTDRPKLPTVHLCTLEPLPERTPLLRYNCQGQQCYDCQGTQKPRSLPTPERKAIPPPVQYFLQPQNTGRLPKIPNRHRRRQCPVTGGTVLFSRLVATLLATANPASTGCQGLALSCCLAG